MFQFPPDHGPYLTDNPPLVRAVVQVAFAPAAHLATADGLAALQDALGDQYLLQPQVQQGLQITFGQPAAMPQRYIFSTPDGYTLAVTPQDMTLSIDERYQSRAAFGEKLEHAVAAIARAGRVRQALRIGVRYINAAPSTIEQFRAWFKPEFTGWAGTTVVSGNSERAWVVISQLNAGAETHPANIGVIRYGYLPQGVGEDVTVGDASKKPSFLADIDLGNSNIQAFEAETIGQMFREINHMIAAFFAYTLTEDGKAAFGLRPKEVSA